MGNEVINVKGVLINKSDYKGVVKEGRTEYVELKNGVKIDIWTPHNKKQQATVHIDENNKVVINNVFIGSLIGTAGNDNIEMRDCGSLRDVNLGSGNDKISVFNSKLASINCGDGTDYIRLKDSLVFKDLHAEKVEFYHSNTLGKVFSEDTLFTDNSSFIDGKENLHGQVEIRNCEYKKDGTKVYD